MVDLKTANFHRLDPQTILSEIDDVLAEMGKERSSGRVIALNSLENRVHLLELQDRSQVVVKFYRPGRWSNEALREEHELLFAAQNEEIPVVAPLQNRVGQSVFETHLGVRYSLFPRVRGRLTCELTLPQAEVLGRYLGRLHALCLNRPLVHRPPLDIFTFGDASLDTLEASKLPDTPQKQRYVQVADDFLALVEPILNDLMGHGMQTVHGDCHVGNVLWDGEAPFLLDFDDMTTCLPVQDIWLIAPGRDTESSEIREVVLRGYEQFHHFDRGQLTAIEALRGLRMIHYVAWIARRWEDPMFPATFPDFSSDRYWQEESQALMESASLISCG